MKFKSYIPLAVLATVSLASCDNEPDIIGKDGYNAVFATTVNTVSTIFVKDVTTEAVGYVQAGLASKSETDVIVTFGANPSKVADYNAIYSMDAVMLPGEYYTITEPNAVIPAGTNKCNPVEIKFTKLNQLDFTHTYVLPVSIVNAPCDILSDNTYYFVVTESALINVVADLNKNYAIFENGLQADELGNLTQVTVEALLYPNQMTNMISTLMGIENTSLFRFGDAGVAPTQLQFATSNGNVSDPAWSIEVGRWNAVSVTFDSATGEVNMYINGVKKGSTQVSNYRQAINWNTASGDITDGPRGFYIGYSYDGNRYFNGQMSEVRIWNRVLTAEEINAPYHAYYVEPDAEGLVAYWKFDDAAGRTIKDYANGYNLVCDKDPEWISVSLPAKN